MSEGRLRTPDELNDDLDRFVTIFLHDLRSPITTAAGYAETVQRGEGKLSEELRSELLDGVRRSVYRIEELAAAAERLQTARRRLLITEPEPVHIAELLERAAEEADLPPLLEVADDVVVSIRREFVEQAVREMLTNVADHTPFETSAWVRAQPLNDSGVVITVDDDGPGIPSELRERIFAPYHRGMAAPSRGGFGLGLAIVDAVAAAHDGRAWVEESPEGGASFRLLLRSAS